MVDRIRELVARELTLIKDAERREALRAVLIREPRREERDWDYGETDERYPYWVVAEAPERGIILVYCEQGFGPEFPWGFLSTDEPNYTSLGMDSQWNWYLEEAFVRSGVWRGEVREDEAFHLSPEERGIRRPSPDA